MSSTERAASSGSSSTWIKMRTISSRSRRRAATSNGSSRPALNSRSLVVMPAYSGCMGPLPNGSRLSCGATAGGRKRPALRYELVGAQTYASPERRPRQLQALVRQRHCITQLVFHDGRRNPPTCRERLGRVRAPRKRVRPACEPLCVPLPLRISPSRNALSRTLRQH